VSTFLLWVQERSFNVYTQNFCAISNRAWAFTKMWQHLYIKY
jgi:hypothetical protein